MKTAITFIETVQKGNKTYKDLKATKTFEDSATLLEIKEWIKSKYGIQIKNISLSCDDNSNNNLVMATYKFPNGNVATFDYDDQQISELQGIYSKELYEKIKQRSDKRTSWNGF